MASPLNTLLTPPTPSPKTSHPLHKKTPPPTPTSHLPFAKNFAPTSLPHPTPFHKKPPSPPPPLTHSHSVGEGPLTPLLLTVPPLTSPSPQSLPSPLSLPLLLFLQKKKPLPPPFLQKTNPQVQKPAKKHKKRKKCKKELTRVD